MADHYSDIYSVKGELLGEAQVEKALSRTKASEWILASFNPKTWLSKAKKKVPYTGDQSMFLVRKEEGRFVLHQTIALMEAN